MRPLPNLPPGLVERTLAILSGGRLHRIPIGILRRRKLARLQDEFGFDPWHISPKEFRPYAMDIIEYLNKISSLGTVVEIGSGLGEIIRYINSNLIFGFDTCSKVILAAKELDTENHVNFNVGSFEDIYNETIDFLLTLNFTHRICPRDLATMFRSIIENNRIQNIIVDVNPHGEFAHDFRFLTSEYIAETTIGHYLGRRTVLVYSRIA